MFFKMHKGGKPGGKVRGEKKKKKMRFLCLGFKKYPLCKAFFLSFDVF